jgi:hypothetical protein
MTGFRLGIVRFGGHTIVTFKVNSRLLEMINARRYLLGLLLVTLAGSCPASQQVSVNEDTRAAVAKAAIRDLANALQAELKSALQTGGPVAAIAVCNAQAVPVTTTVASVHNVTLSRVSLRNRNPANAPNTWQAAVLQDFEKRRSQGEDINKLAWSETVAIDGVREFRFMQAIPTAGVCLTCHGTVLSPEISQALNALYPDDLATGFSEGDIRGAFVVTKTLSN